MPTIYVSKPVKEKLTELAKKKGVARNKVIEDLIKRCEEINIEKLDRVMWYAIKVSMSVGAFKENPTDGNYARLNKTIDQIEERLDIDVKELREAIRRYLEVAKREYKNPQVKIEDINKAKIELNEKLKMTLMNMARKHILEAE